MPPAAARRGGGDVAKTLAGEACANVPGLPATGAQRPPHPPLPAPLGGLDRVLEKIGPGLFGAVQNGLDHGHRQEGRPVAARDRSCRGARPGEVIAAEAWPGVLTVLSPVVMTYFLVYGTGAKLLERHMAERPGYREYQQRTSYFLPRPPRRAAGSSRG